MYTKGIMIEKPVVELFQQRRRQLEDLVDLQDLQVTSRNRAIKIGAKILSKVVGFLQANTEGRIARHTDTHTILQVQSGEFNTDSTDLLQPLPIDEA